MALQFQKKESKFPFGTVFLFIFFVIIGILDYDGRTLSTFSEAYVSVNIMDPDLRLIYSLKPVFQLQWQLFTYSLIHFAIVHYAYSGLLLAYYIVPLERDTHPLLIVLGFYLSAIIWPVIGGIIFSILIYLYPPWSIYITDIAHLNFLGSSVGIWALIGLASPYQYRRKLYWVPVIFLLFFEFTLKIIVQRTDLATNFLHVITYLVMWKLSSRIIGIRGNSVDQAFSVKNKQDWFFIIFALLCASILVWHTIYVFSIA